MAELPDAWIAVLNVLVEGPVAWRSPTEIAQALGRDAGETTDMLCDLDVAGWLALWESDLGPLITLSPLAAERLGARLVEVGPVQTPRWARAGDPDPPPPWPKNVCRSERAAALDFVIDPGPPPDMVALRGEQAESLAQAVQDKTPPAESAESLPRPSLLIGLGLSPWPGPGTPRSADCPACGGRTLGPQMYCLYCDRWGLDRIAFGPSPNPTGAPVGRKRRPRPEPDRVALERLQAERLRTARKTKRRLRRQVQTEADRRRQPQAGSSAPRNSPAPLSESSSSTLSNPASASACE